MVTSVIVGTILILVLTGYCWRIGRPGLAKARRAQVTDYSGSIGGVILVTFFGVGYVLALIFVVIGLAVPYL